MNITIPFTTAIFWCALFVGAQSVSLKGTVKKTGGTAGLAGVKVSLIGMADLSTVTGTDGAFVLTGTTAAAKSRNGSDASAQFMIRGNALVFSAAFKGSPVSVTVFGGDGRIKSSVKFSGLADGKQCLQLPELSPGLNIMRVVAGNETCIRTLVRVNNDLLPGGKPSNEAGSGSLIIAKRFAGTAVDTLKAEKDGYLAKKVAIDSYSMDNITVELDTNAGGNPGECTRESLKAVADAYVAAQKAGDPSTLPLAPEVKYTQNNKAVTAEKCICKTAMPVDNSMSLFDVDSCRTFVEIISSTGSTQWVLMAWLKVENGKISEVDAIVTTKGDFMFNAKNYLTYTKAQDWSVLPQSQQSPRQTLIKGADAYLDMFKEGVDNGVPWGKPCERVEGGNMHVTPDCIVGMPGHGGTGTVNIINRRYVVDEDMGTVDVFCSFGGAMPDSHMFRLIDGKIRLVHTLTVMSR